MKGTKEKEGQEQTAGNAVEEQQPAAPAMEPVDPVDEDEEDDEPWETQPDAHQADETGQTMIPGTEPPAETPKDPRSLEDISYDFRMAVFTGQIKKVTEDWKNGRKLNVIIESGDRARLTHGLEKFSASDDLIFRVLPTQPRLGEMAPEEFASKVPSFCVEMVDRLERKAIEGFAGWTELTPAEVMKRMSEIMGEASGSWDQNELDYDHVLLQKSAIDLANFAFFMWQNSRMAATKSKAVI